MTVSYCHIIIKILMTNINLKSLNFFAASICNSKCRNCFYKSNLNKGNDLAFERIENLSKSLGRINVLNISGGEPFLKKDIAEIVHAFIKNNKIRAVSIPTNGLLPSLIEKQTKEILKVAGKRKVIVCISLDGTKKMHDKLRGVNGNFKNAMRTYKELKKLKKNYPNFSLRINTVVYKENYDDLFNLYSEIPKSFPGLEAVTLSLGRPVNFSEKYNLPEIQKLKKLFLFKQKNTDKKRSFLRRLIEKIVFILSIQRLEERKQIIPCLAGKNQGVVYANGDVALCEMLPVLGNIKNESFRKIWHSKKANEQREKIRQKRCFCTHEGFLFHSLLNQPAAWPQVVVKTFLK